MPWSPASPMDQRMKFIAESVGSVQTEVSDGTNAMFLLPPAVSATTSALKRLTTASGMSTSDPQTGTSGRKTLANRGSHG